jgi:electron transfer flavoprotein alpha subunit
MAGVVIAFAESRDGKLRRSAFEAARAASGLAKDLGGSAVAIAVGDGLDAEAAGLGGFGVEKVLLVKTGGASYAAARWARTLAKAARDLEAAAVLVPASIPGKELAPLVAAELDAGLLPDVTGLEVEGGAIQATRPVYAGKVNTVMKAAKQPVVVSIRPKAFAPGDPDAGATASVEELALAPEEAHDAKMVSFEATGGGKIELTEADVIVSGGRGMKGPENYNLIEELAGILGAAVGASRSAVDAGWRPHADQVGQTGKTVSPDLYVACGISGAIQHLAGMGSSKVIVAINKDPEAPIFKVANYGLVGDLFKVVPVLTEEVKKIKE